MKLLIITPYIPYPLSEGGRISQFAIIDYIRHKVKLTLVLVVYSEIDKVSAAELQKIWNEHITIIVVDQCPVFTKPSTASRIKNKIVRTLSSKEPQPQSSTGFEDELIIYPPKSKGFISEIGQIVDSCNPDLVQVDFLPYVDLAFSLPKLIKKVFIHHELRFGRVASSLQTLNKLSSYETCCLELVKAHEMSLLQHYDGVIVFSDNDKAKLSNELKETQVFVAPFPVLDSAFRPVKKETLQANKLIFLGGQDHMPNKDAVEWYLKEIAAKVWAKNQLCLHVVGKWSEEVKNQYVNNQMIHFAGYVEDLATYCENSIMIVPLRIGSGIRTKILYSMAYGVPVVTTSLGCEGIKGRNGEEFLIADDPEEFSAAIDQLYTNADYAYKIAVQAYDFVSKYYSQKAAGELRLACLRSIYTTNNKSIKDVE